MNTPDIEPMTKPQRGVSHTWTITQGGGGMWAFRVFGDGELVAELPPLTSEDCATLAEDLAEVGRLAPMAAPDLGTLTQAVEALFARVGEDFRTAYVDLPGEQAFAVVFCNGRMKREGEAPDPAPYSISDFVTAVACVFPDHSRQRLHWRVRPEKTEFGDVRFRIAATTI